MLVPLRLRHMLSKKGRNSQWQAGEIKVLQILSCGRASGNSRLTAILATKGLGLMENLIVGMSVSFLQSVVVVRRLLDTV